MIFLTVGAQMPFDRLVRCVDEWAREEGRPDVQAQIGSTDYEPHSLQVLPHLSADRFKQTVESADAVIGHAGMGTILSALVAGKPLLVLPRLGRLRETRNDHQVATARRMSELGLVRAAMDEEELRVALNELDDLQPARRLGPHASPALIHALREFLHA